MSAPALLEVEGVDVAYGPLQVLFDVSIHVDPGERVALLGTNGAGKSTLLRAISGLKAVDAGTLRFQGCEITDLAPHARVELGIVQMAGGRGTFPSLTVEENLRIGAYPFLRDADRVAGALDMVYGLFPALASRRQQQGGTLSGGEQQMMALGRTLMRTPGLLIIDELSLGLAPVVVGLMLEVLEELSSRGIPMLVVEQSINVAASITDRAYFLEKGEVRFSGPTAELLDRGDLARAVFLGRRSEGAV